jgi:hypothetical protein
VDLIAAIEHRVQQTSGIVPLQILLVDRGTIPRTPSGKVRYLDLQKTVLTLTGTAEPPEDSGS